MSEVNEGDFMCFFLVATTIKTESIPRHSTARRASRKDKADDQLHYFLAMECDSRTA